jgi:hypothetical protein
LEVWLDAGFETSSETKVALCGFYYFYARGGIAQLGERLHGMQEVIGSIPFTSTNSAEVGSL